MKKEGEEFIENNINEDSVNNNKNFYKKIILLIVIIVFIAVILLVIYLLLLSKVPPPSVQIQNETGSLILNSAYISSEKSFISLSLTNRVSNEISDIKITFLSKNGTGYNYTFYKIQFPKFNETKEYQINSIWIFGLKDFSNISSFILYYKVNGSVYSISMNNIEIKAGQKNKTSVAPQVSSGGGGGGGGGGGPTCIPSCSGKVCGDDSCGGSCGTCNSGYYCLNNSCVYNNSNNTNPYLLNQDFGNLKLIGIDNLMQCYILNDDSCDFWEARYNSVIGGVDNPRVFVEVHNNTINISEFNDSLNSRAIIDNWTLLRGLMGKGYVDYLSRDNNSNYDFIFVWPHQNLLVGLEFYNWNYSIFNPNDFSNILSNYTQMYPSDIVPPPNSCIDSDGGINYLIAGNVTQNGYEYDDYCIDSTTLIEYYCNPDNLTYSDWHDCDYQCSNGVCVNEPSLVTSSVATLKNSYAVNEPINLTDPPEKISYENNLTQITQPEKIVDENGNYAESSPSIKPNSCIVQLKSPALVARYVEAQKNNQVYSSQAANDLEYEHSMAKLDIQSYLDNGTFYNMGFFDRLINSIKRIFGITGYAIDNQDIKVEKEFYKTFNGMLLGVSCDKLKGLENSQYIKNIYPDISMKVELNYSVPLIGADKTWQLDSDGNNCSISGKPCLTGINRTIAVIDTGVDYTNPDFGSCTTGQFLNGTCFKVIGGWNFGDNNSDVIDYYGHGTHVAGIAAGNGALKGVAPDSKIYAYKVMDRYGYIGWDYIQSAFDAAVDPNGDNNFNDKVDVATMSIGAIDYYRCDPDGLLQNIQNTINLGVTVVIAAGNDGSKGNNTVTYPACLPDAITVGATSKYSNPYVADYSSRGPGINNKNLILKPDIVAPGDSICSAQANGTYLGSSCNGNYYIYISGTSMATPHVSGASLLIKQAFPNLTALQVKELLMNHANSPISYNLYSKTDIGSGLINVSNAIIKYAANKLIIEPGSVSFGAVDLNSSIWKNSQKIKIYNNKSSSVTVTIANVATLPSGISFNFPSSLTIPGNSIGNFDFNITVNNNVGFGYYEGDLVLNYSGDSIKVPWFVEKTKLKISLNKYLTNVGVKINVISDVPVTITKANVIKPDLSVDSIYLSSDDEQHYKSNYSPDIDGNYTIYIEANNGYGIMLNGTANFISDKTKPILTLNLTNNNKTITVSSNKDVNGSFSEDVISKLDGSDIRYWDAGATVESLDNKSYTNYIMIDDSGGGFTAPFYIYGKEYDAISNNYSEENEVVNGPDLFNYLTDLYQRPYMGYSVFMYGPPLLVKNSKGNLYTVFGYETNNRFCGVSGIGIKKYNKVTGNWVEMNSTLIMKDVCSNDSSMCEKPSQHQDQWCDQNIGGPTTDYIDYDYRALPDSKGNIYIFWREKQRGVYNGSDTINRFSIYYKKISSDGAAIVDRGLVANLNPNNITQSYYTFNWDVAILKNDTTVLVVSEAIDNSSYPNYSGKRAYYKIFDPVSLSWSNNYNITTLYVNVYQIKADINNLIHITYDLDHNDIYTNWYYGILNLSNKSVDMVSILKQYGGGNKGGIFTIGDNKNIYFSHQTFDAIGSNWGVYYLYNIFNSGLKQLENGILYVSGYASLSRDSISIDKFGNYYTMFISDSNMAFGGGGWTHPDEIVMKKYTGKPSITITKPDYTKDSYELNYSGGVWKTDLNYSIENNYLVEAYATDKAGNIGYASLGFVLPQSKLTNEGSNSVSGELLMILQKNVSNSWQNVSIVVDKQITINPGDVVKLDQQWNPNNVKASSAGNYRVYVAYLYEDKITEAFWKFDVV